jgi:hypothetical protein
VLEPTDNPNQYNRSKDPNESGYIWEEQVFRVSSKMFAKPVYLSWQDAVSDAIERQKDLRWNPTKPRTSVGKEMFECVQSYLPKYLADKLQFFCAIGTALDWYHGVDGFFEIDGFLVTIDLVYSEKQQAKADILFSKKEANILLWRVCLEIAQRLRTGLR